MNKRVLFILPLILGLSAGYLFSFGYQPQVANLTIENSDLASNVTKLNAIITDLRQEVQSIQTKDSTGTSLAEQIEALTLEKTRIESEISSITTEKMDLEELKIKLETETAQLRKESEELQDPEGRDQALIDRIAELDKDLVTVRVQLDDLQAEIDQLNEKNDSLELIYTDLLTKWNIWKEHSNLSPSPRSEYRWSGHAPGTGNYTITQPTIFFSFPDVANCLRVESGIATGSMRPAFDAGHELILSRCFNHTDLNAGDIILYRDSGGEIIGHQIFEIIPTGVITKGIHNEFVDGGVVAWSDILYIVVGIIY